MATVALRGIDKVFADGTHAVRGLDLDVADGELMVLVGPSGCGKSTILRMVAGLEEVSSGDILLDGRAVQDEPPQRRNVAMVFQNYALYPHMTVRRNLEFPLRMARAPRAERERRVGEAATLLDLVPLLEKRPGQLSGGQRQRVAMGRAIVREPVVFLMDEPLSNLDAELRVQIRAEIAALQRRIGTTMIYVTHDQVEAMTLGDRVAVLRDGALQQVGTPGDLYEHPRNVFVAGFLGSPGMNVFPGRLREGEGRALVADVARQELRLEAPPDEAPGFVDRPLFLGIRPEHLGPAEAYPEASRLRVTVEAVEALGHERLVHVRIPESPIRLVARFGGGEPATPGESLELGVDLARVRLFREDGEAV
jgi:ABC-type sugar transport system ATPase subunit